MKRSDIFSLVLIAGIGVVASFVVCNAIMGDPDMKKVEFKTMAHVIKKNLASPDPEVFNSYAINPTIEVYVGDCEDIDQNGMLDTAELIMCGKVAPEELPTGENVDRAELERLRDSGGCVKTPEGSTLCGEEKKTYIEGLLKEE